MMKNEFQTISIKLITSILKTYNTKLNDIEDIKGETEDYLKTSFEYNNEKYPLYIYENELGFYFGKKWFHCEDGAYDNEEELRSHFIELLKKNIFTQ